MQNQDTQVVDLLRDVESERNFVACILRDPERVSFEATAAGLIDAAFTDESALVVFMVKRREWLSYSPNLRPAAAQDVLDRASYGSRGEGLQQCPCRRHDAREARTARVTRGLFGALEERLTFGDVALSLSDGVHGRSIREKRSFAMGTICAR